MQRKSNSKWAEHIALRAICNSKHPDLGEFLMMELREDHFLEEAYKKVYQRVQSYYNRSGRILSWKELLMDTSLSTKVLDKLKSAETKRKQLTKADDGLLIPKRPEETLNLLETIRLEAQRVNLVEFQNKLTQQISKLGSDLTTQNTSGIIHYAMSNIETISGLGGGTGNIMFTPKMDFKKYIKQFQLKLKTKRLLPTGFSVFDRENHGLPKTANWLIAAKTGCGKSSLALQIAMNVFQMGARVCMVSLEMDEDENLTRVASNLTGIPSNRLIGEFDAYKKKIYTAWRDFFKPNGAATFDFYTPEESETLVNILSTLKPYKYDIIIIDYITLVAPMDNEGWKSLDKAGRYAKVFATNNKTIICLLAQLDSSKNDVRYARALMEHASNCWKWHEDQEEIKELGYIQIRQPKARGQNPFSFKLKADLSCTRFSDINSSDDSNDSDGGSSSGSTRGKDIRKIVSDKDDDTETYDDEDA